jgi:2'-5' RNA ligase
MDDLRAFIAIELEPEILQRMGALQARLREEVPEGLVRWVKPEGIHLTLQFLGDVSAARVEAIAEAMRQTCAAYAPFRFTVGGMGCFPDARRPRVVWVGVDEPGGVLAGLQRSIVQALKPLGFAPEKRPFSAHLTLGRVKEGRPAALQALGARVAQGGPEIGQQTAAEVHLIRSDLRPSGAVYTTLAVAPLDLGR